MRQGARRCPFPIFALLSTLQLSPKASLFLSFFSARIHVRPRAQRHLHRVGTDFFFSFPLAEISRVADVSSSYLTLVFYHLAGNSLSEVESRLSVALWDSQRGGGRDCEPSRGSPFELSGPFGAEIAASVNSQRWVTRPIFPSSRSLFQPFRGHTLALNHFKAQPLSCPGVSYVISCEGWIATGFSFAAV